MERAIGKLSLLVRLYVCICTEYVSGERERRLSYVVEDVAKVFNSTKEEPSRASNMTSSATIEAEVNGGKDTIPKDKTHKRWVQLPSPELPTPRLVSAWKRDVLTDRQSIASSAT